METLITDIKMPCRVNAENKTTLETRGEIHRAIQIRFSLLAGLFIAQLPINDQDLSTLVNPILVLPTSIFADILKP